jgi:lysophospholipase L1-like esterase
METLSQNPCLRRLALVFLLAASTLQLHAQSDPSVSIMPLGDSLTWGYDGGPDNPTYLDNLDTGGYRTPLYGDLSLANINVSYVGVDNGNASPTLTAAGQTADNGFNGYRIDDIANNLAGSVAGSDGVSNDGGYWLTGGGGTNRGPETANIILLQIGTNDLAQKYDPLFNGTPGTETASQLAADTTTRLESLISEIMYYEPNAWIYTDGTSIMLNNAFDLSASGDYEADVQAMVAADFAGQHVYYVNMQQGLAPGSFSAYENDGIHLTSLGYSLMGQTWATAIEDTYDFSDDSDPAPVPEPSTFGLLAAGALALLGWRKMRAAT